MGDFEVGPGFEGISDIVEACRIPSSEVWDAICHYIYELEGDGQHEVQYYVDLTVASVSRAMGFAGWQDDLRVAEADQIKGVFGPAVHPFQQQPIPPFWSLVRRLDLSGCDNRSWGLPLNSVGVFLREVDLSHLSSLVMRSMKLNSLDGQFLAKIARIERGGNCNLERLRGLDLADNNRIGNWGASHILESPVFRGDLQRGGGLRSLDLSLTSIGGHIFEGLIDFLRNSRLQHLALHGNPLGSKCVSDLVGSDAVKNLNSLELGRTGSCDSHDRYRGLDDDFITALCESSHLSNLRHLGLSRNLIRNIGIERVIDHADLPNLEWLDLSCNRLSSYAYSALANSEVFPRLKVLDLTRNFCYPTLEDFAGLLRSPFLANTEIRVNISLKDRSDIDQFVRLLQTVARPGGVYFELGAPADSKGVWQRHFRTVVNKLQLPNVAVELYEDDCPHHYLEVVPKIAF